MVGLSYRKFVFVFCLRANIFKSALGRSERGRSGCRCKLSSRVECHTLDSNDHCIWVGEKCIGLRCLKDVVCKNIPLAAMNLRKHNSGAFTIV